MSAETQVETQEAEAQETFDDIFHSPLDGPAPVADKEPEPAAEAKAEDAPEKEAEAEPEKEEAKGEEAKEESEAEDTPPVSKDALNVPIGALHDERDKRQAGEARIKELEAKIKGEDKTERPDLVEDPEGFAKSIEDRVERAAEERHFNASEHRARKEHGDDAVDEAMETFLTMVKADPLLGQKAQNHPEPFEFVIETATTHKAVEEAGGLEEWRTTERTKMRAELKAELETELTDKSDAKEKTRSALPETLAGEANKGERTGPEWSEPSLDDLVTDIEDHPPTK